MFTHIQITILLSAPKSYSGHMIYCGTAAQQNHARNTWCAKRNREH